MTGRPVPVSWLGEGEAESVVDRWHKSRIPQQRQLVKSLLALALASAYGHPGPEWDRMGYPGPIDRAPDGSPGLEPLDVRNEGELSCDVVVVGSGAGGACVASELASADSMSSWSSGAAISTSATSTISRRRLSASCTCTGPRSRPSGGP